MTTTSVNPTYDSLPTATKAVGLALSILVERICALSRADRDDLFELVMMLRKTESPEEVEEVYRAMEEILAQTPVRAKPMTLSVSDSLTPGLHKWAEHVGKKIRSLRKQAHMNQEALAKKSGLTQSHISRIENAEHSPTNFTLQKIASALGVEVRDIDPCLE